MMDGIDASIFEVFVPEPPPHPLLPYPSLPPLIPGLPLHTHQHDVMGVALASQVFLDGAMQQSMLVLLGIAVWHVYV